MPRYGIPPDRARPHTPVNPTRHERRTNALLLAAAVGAQACRRRRYNACAMRVELSDLRLAFKFRMGGKDTGVAPHLRSPPPNDDASATADGDAGVPSPSDGSAADSVSDGDAEPFLPESLVAMAVSLTASAAAPSEAGGVGHTVHPPLQRI